MDHKRDQEIAEMYRRGFTPKNIAKWFRITRQRVDQILIEQGVELHGHELKLSGARLELAIYLYESVGCVNVELVASVFRVGKEVVRTEFKKSGVTVKGRRIEKYVNQKDLRECYERQMTCIETGKFLNISPIHVSRLWRGIDLVRGTGWKPYSESFQE